jgi:hypothetical protein
MGRSPQKVAGTVQGYSDSVPYASKKNYTAPRSSPLVNRRSRVVVGEGDGGEFLLDGERKDLARGEFAVLACVRVDVQVDL